MSTSYLEGTLYNFSVNVKRKQNWESDSDMLDEISRAMIDTNSEEEDHLEVSEVEYEKLSNEKELEERVNEKGRQDKVQEDQ